VDILVAIFAPLLVALAIALPFIAIAALVIAVRCRRELRAIRDALARLDIPAPQPGPPAMSAARAEAVPLEPEAPPAPALQPGATAGARPPAFEWTPPPEPEQRPAGPSWTVRWEANAAKRLLTWAGAAVLFLGVAFFLKYAFDQDWLGPKERVALGVVGGIVMLGVGERLVRRSARVLGQGVIGGGLAVLYASLFAGFAMYGLFPQAAAFGAMVGVTVAGAVLAVAHNALPISLIALLGGLLTPVLVSTGEDNRTVLFTYIAVLDLSVVAGIALRKWRVLDLVAFAGTWALVAGWYHQFYEPSAQVPALAWTSVFFLLLLLPAAIALYRGLRLPGERLLMGVVNGFVAYGFAADMLADSPHALGWWTLAAAACYGALSMAAMRRVRPRAMAFLVFAAAASLGLTVALRHLVNGDAVVIAWAAEALAIVYLGHRLGCAPLRAFGPLILLAAACRLFLVHWPLHVAAFTPVFNRPFATALCIPVSAGLCALLGRVRAHRDAPPSGIGALMACTAGVFAHVLAHAELALWLQHVRGLTGFGLERAAGATAAVLWTAGACAFLLSGMTGGSPAARLAALIPLAVAAQLAARLYGLELNAYTLFLNTRFGVGLLVVSVAFGASALLRGMASCREKTTAATVCVLAVVCLLVLLSVEGYHYCTDVIAGDAGRQSAQMAVSIVWGAYAAACILIGFWRRARWLRLGALGLFALTAAKLLLVDMAGVEQVYRIVTFIALGLLMIGASYVYHLAEKRLDAPPETDSDGPAPQV